MVTQNVAILIAPQLCAHKHLSNRCKFGLSKQQLLVALEIRNMVEQSSLFDVQFSVWIRHSTPTIMITGNPDHNPGDREHVLDVLAGALWDNFLLCVWDDIVNVPQVQVHTNYDQSIATMHFSIVPLIFQRETFPVENSNVCTSFWLGNGQTMHKAVNHSTIVSQLLIRQI